MELLKSISENKELAEKLKKLSTIHVADPENSFVKQCVRLYQANERRKMIEKQWEFHKIYLERF